MTRLVKVSSRIYSVKESVGGNVRVISPGHIPRVSSSNPSDLCRASRIIEFLSLASLYVTVMVVNAGTLHLSN